MEYRQPHDPRKEETILHQMRLWRWNEPLRQFRDESSRTKNNPLNSISKVSREISISLINGRRIPIGEGLDMKTRYEGLLGYVTHEIGEGLAEELHAILELNADLSYLPLTHNPQTEELWERVSLAYNDADDTTWKVFELGKAFAIQNILRKLQGSAHLNIFAKEGLEGIPHEETDDWDEWKFPTKLAGVDVHYFYLKEEQDPTISLSVTNI